MERSDFVVVIVCHRCVVCYVAANCNAFDWSCHITYWKIRPRSAMRPFVKILRPPCTNSWTYRDAVWELTHVGPTSEEQCARWGQDWMNLFALSRGDKSAMLLLAKLLWTHRIHCIRCGLCYRRSSVLGQRVSVRVTPNRHIDRFSRFLHSTPVWSTNGQTNRQTNRPRYVQHP